LGAAANTGDESASASVALDKHFAKRRNIEFLPM
jgi:hypothetical protein